MHQRQVIRTKVKDLLVAGATVAADRVFPSRILPLRALNLPAIAVYTNDDVVDPDSLQTSPRELTRELEVVIEGWVAAGAVTDPAVEQVDDLMDDLAEEIETIMHLDPYLGDTVSESILANTETEIVEEGARTLGLLLMTYSVTYRCLAPVAPVLADDFKTVGAEHNVTGEKFEDIDPDRPETAHDDFVVEEPPPP